MASTILALALYAAIAAKEGWEGPGTRGAAGEIGPYQITFAYWLDARMPTGRHEDCENPAYARETMRRYWQRHCPSALRAGHIEILAAVHHWGPKGRLHTWHRRDDYVQSILNLTERSPSVSIRGSLGPTSTKPPPSAHPTGSPTPRS
jgi:hypothetical protein